MSKISIIVPVYNAEKTLVRCVESIINQTYQTWELWLIDDGSSDASREICDSYSEHDIRIQVVHKKNEGVSATRNVGIEKADGEYVMFVDSDDYLEPNALELMIGETNKHDTDVVMCGFFYHFEESGEVRPNYLEEEFFGGNDQFVNRLFKKTFTKELLNPPWNKLFKKKLLENDTIRFISEYSICEDMIFTVELLKASEKVVFLNLPLYHYFYKKGDNLVNKFHINFYEALSAYYERVYSYLKKNNALDTLYLEVDRFFVDKTISYFKKIYSYDSYGKKKKYFELRRICADLRGRGILQKYRPIGIKKKIVSTCIKYKWYELLHLLYLMV